MGERKVLNKYYPPDFDPAILPRNKKPRDQQINVRTMLPMSIQCNTCGEYLYKGKKFNAKKETCLGEDYLGIEVFRFYIRCVNCAQQITFKTDPKNADYACEFGASRNFEPWRQEATENEEARKQREEEDADSMRRLENKTIDNRQEMDILDALDELRSLQARREDLTHEQVLQANLSKKEDISADGLTDTDREYIQKVFQEKKEVIRRLDERGSPDAGLRKRIIDDSVRPSQKKKTKFAPVFVVKKKEQPPVEEYPKQTDSDPKPTQPPQTDHAPTAEEQPEEHMTGLSFLSGYGSGSE